MNDRLFMVGGGRIATCRVSGLHSGLDAFIGERPKRDCNLEADVYVDVINIPRISFDNAARCVSFASKSGLAHVQR